MPRPAQHFGDLFNAVSEQVAAESAGFKCCPFCGDAPSLWDDTNGLVGLGTLTIYCCSEMNEQYVLSWAIDSINKKDDRKHALSALIKRWNKRA